ncbi:MAG: ribonuclease P protein component [Rickettsiales bacterium]|nr:ribonuclease P protein component [Rickettsiales bacterium]
MNRSLFSNKTITMKILSIKKRRDILKSRNEGKSFKSNKFIFIKTPIIQPKNDSLKKMLDTNVDFVRLLVVVSKKVDKRAVIRNRIRRRVKEAFRTSLNNLQNHHDYQIIVKKNIADVEFNEIKTEIELVKKNNSLEIQN